MKRQTKELKIAINAKANNGKIVKTALKEWMNEEEKVNKMIHAFLSDSKGKIISTKDFFFYWPNKLNLPETTSETKVKYADGQYTLTLKSNKLAKDLFVEIPVQGARFSDNFIDLLPGEKRTIVITSPLLKAADKLRHDQAC